MSQLEDQDQAHEHIQARQLSRVHFPLDPNSYKLVAEIGAGVSAVVYKALCLPLNSAAVAIKSIDLDQPSRRAASSSSSPAASDALENVRREAKFMSLLSHPNILNAHCSFTVGRRLWVVMPFMSGGSLHSIMAAASPAGLPEPAIAPVLRDTLRALAYLHAQGHLHRDIKAGNILLDGVTASVKLADFGVSASLHDSSSARLGASPLTDIAGTPYWMAPEVIHSHTGYGTKADIWSFGITALELAHGRPPLSHLPLSKSLVLKITKRFRFSDYENCGGDKGREGRRFSRAFKEMVGLCLNQEPAKRPTADKLLKHSFFKNCKGLDYLVKNVLQRLPSVEERFKVFKSGCDSNSSVAHDDRDLDEDVINGGLEEKKRRISGWNFNEDGFELDPVFPTESEDDSASEKASSGGGETVVVKEGESSGELDSSLLSQTGEESNNELDESMPGELCESISPINSPSHNLELPDPNSPTLQTITVMAESTPSSPGKDESTSSQGGIDRERVLRDLLSLRRSIDMERTALSDILRLIGAAEAAEPQTREAYLEAVAERARSELEMEKRRNSELELEIEFLKMQLQKNK